MKILTKTGFTLIELLVVITIIGILATGATTVYTSQIQKARDTVRINDVKALQAGIEQVYQDAAEYPEGDDFGTTGDDSLGTPISGVKTYVPKIPSDPKAGQNCNNGGSATPGTKCAYVYAVSADSNGIGNGVYEISTSFENTGNVTSKANDTKDGGNDNIRLEFGLEINTVDSSIAAADTIASGSGSTSPKFVIQGEVRDF